MLMLYSYSIMHSILNYLDLLLLSLSLMLPLTFRDYSDDELKVAIDRLTLEKRYIDLVKSMQPEKKKSKVLSVMGGILEKTANNIGAQLVTYGTGEMINKRILMLLFAG